MSGDPLPGERSSDALKRRGLVALGDSITRASGQAMLGLPMQSWALWLAEALALPFTCLARDGARAQDVRAEQLPRLRGPYELGCLYVGVNDVRSDEWAPEAYQESLEVILRTLRGQAETVLVVKLPARIGRTRSPRTAIEAANARIDLLASVHGALTLELDGLAGSELVLPDAVHLTARGEARLALLACRRLARAGMDCEEAELLEALAPLSAGARLRYALSSLALGQLRDGRRLLLEAAARRAGG